MNWFEFLSRYILQGLSGLWSMWPTFLSFGTAATIGVLKTDINSLSGLFILMVMYAIMSVKFYYICKLVIDAYVQIVAGIANQNNPLQGNFIALVALLLLSYIFMPVISNMLHLQYMFPAAVLQAYGHIAMIAPAIGGGNQLPIPLRLR